MKIEIKYDRKFDSIYLFFSDGKIAFSKKLDENRSVDYSDEGEIRGIRFNSASTTLKTDDLPHKSTIEYTLQEKQVYKILQKRAESAHKQHEYVPLKARLTRIYRTALTVPACLGIAFADVALARNLFIPTNSLPALTASLMGLVVTMLPTVAGAFILVSWAFYTRSQTGRL